MHEDAGLINIDGRAPRAAGAHRRNIIYRKSGWSRMARAAAAWTRRWALLLLSRATRAAAWTAVTARRAPCLPLAWRWRRGRGRAQLGARGGRVAAVAGASAAGVRGERRERWRGRRDGATRAVLAACLAVLASRRWALPLLARVASDASGNVGGLWRPGDTGPSERGSMHQGARLEACMHQGASSRERCPRHDPSCRLAIEAGSAATSSSRLRSHTPPPGQPHPYVRWTI